MGIDLHNLHFLAHAQDLGTCFGHTVAIGRQALFVDPQPLEAHRRARGLPPLHEPAQVPGVPRYFEPLVQQWLGAGVADAVDASPYENAALIHDMNLPWPADGPLAAARGRYDAVIDFGCLEHVFNFPVAQRNCVDLCRVGGHVLHALPANNLSGHGFYQFSPELFFNLYQPARGFELRGAFFALKAEPRYWWRVASPLQVQRRVTLCNSHEVYLMVLARKLHDTGPLPAPQQSDYAQGEWLAAPAAAGGHGAGRPALRQRVAALLADAGVLNGLRAGRDRLRALGRSGVNLPAPDYQRIRVADLLRRLAP